MVSAGVKELLRSRSANGAKSNFMQWHSAGEMINRFRVSPSVGAVPSSPQSQREQALGQLAGSSLLACSAAEPGGAPCSLKKSQVLGKGEKKFFRAGVSIPMPGRASPAAQVSPHGRPGSASPPMLNEVSASGEMPIRSRHSREHSSAALRQGNDFRD